MTSRTIERLSGMGRLGSFFLPTGQLGNGLARTAIAYYPKRRPRPRRAGPTFQLRLTVRGQHIVVGTNNAAGFGTQSDFGFRLPVFR